VRGQRDHVSLLQGSGRCRAFFDPPPQATTGGYCRLPDERNGTDVLLRGEYTGDVKVSIDYQRCTGAAACEQVCPEVFQIRDDGLAEVLDPEPHETLWECVRRAQDACPDEAIVIEEE
jgi:ferredoxin